ncbi:MAG TPA: hypothetical protein ENJ95_24475 [Bacteroidetes bacterium]|nr:hypothetical protein [Bacteroidota bacterium]
MYLLLAGRADAQIFINVTGEWNYSVSVNDITEAGNDFQGTYSSASNQVLIDVRQRNFFFDLFFNYNWRVDIRKSDIDWHPNLVLSARRTGNGSPLFFSGNVNGGTTYQQVSNANQSFFSGNRSRLDIPVQYRISGVSVLLPAKAYTTTVVYTVTDL